MRPNHIGYTAPRATAAPAPAQPAWAKVAWVHKMAPAHTCWYIQTHMRIPSRHAILWAQDLTTPAHLNTPREMNAIGVIHYYHLSPAFLLNPETKTPPDGGVFYSESENHTLF